MSEYQVGYGRPPRQTRFHKGRSGNPRGRPKQSKGLATMARRILNEKIVIKGNEVERLAQSSAWLYDALRFYVEFHRKQEGLDGAVINDVLAIAYLLQPDILTFSDLRLSVNLEDGQSRGRTKLDTKGSFTRVAMEVQAPPVRRLLFERVLPTGAIAEEAMA